MICEEGGLMCLFTYFSILTILCIGILIIIYLLDRKTSGEQERDW